MPAILRWILSIVVFGLLYAAFQFSEGARERRHAVRDPIIVASLLELAKIDSGDVVYDLECGDGAVVIAAAKERHARSVCVDKVARRIRSAEVRARQAGVQPFIRFRREDWRNVDLSEATVVVLFSPGHWHSSLRDHLTRQLRPGARIVSYLRHLGAWQPAQVDLLESPDGGARRPLILWVADGKFRPNDPGESRPASIPDVWFDRPRTARPDSSP